MLHICCGVCLGGPLEVLQKRGVQVRGHFFNPNIHPAEEFQKRLETVRKIQAVYGLSVTYEDRYDEDKYLEHAMPNDNNRCLRCYLMRLRRTARVAKEAGCEAFSTTLLVSRRQKHDLIRQAGDVAAWEYKIPFHYQDWRPVRLRSIEIAEGLGLYRQKYCGCSFGLSEQLKQVEKKRAEQG